MMYLYTSQRKSSINNEIHTEHSITKEECKYDNYSNNISGNISHESYMYTREENKPTTNRNQRSNYMTMTVTENVMRLRRNNLQEKQEEKRRKIREKRQEIAKQKRIKKYRQKTNKDRVKEYTHKHFRENRHLYQDN